MNKLKRGDEVFVSVGKDKGRRGTIVEEIDNKKVLDEGVNVVKKHTKANPNAGKINLTELVLGKTKMEKKLESSDPLVMRSICKLT